MPLVDVGGHRLHVQEMGAGPPVVFAHGLLLGSLAQWYFTVAPVLSPTRRVILYDLKGHGRSDRVDSGYGLRAMDADLVGLMDALEVEGPYDLVGHSYGGLVALRHAIDHPERVRRLVLVDVPLPPAEVEELSTAKDRAPAEYLDVLPDGTRSELLAGGRRARRLLASLHFLVHQSSLLDEVARERDVDDEELSRMDRPTLALFGAESRCLPAADRLQSLLPDLQRVTVPGGHFVPVEAPAEMVSAIVEFLRD